MYDLYLDFGGCGLLVLWVRVRVVDYRFCFVNFEMVLVVWGWGLVGFFVYGTGV